MNKGNRKIGYLALRTGRFRRDRKGTAAIEFAFLAPVLFLLLIGMFQFGILINNYIQLTEAVRVAGRTLAISRGSSTPITDTRNAVFNSAPTLAQGSLTIALTVDGTPCPSADTTANNATCKGYLDGAQGDQATVTASYSCTNLIVYGTNFMPNCSLSSTTSGRIE
jgi:Flp pilus assembly protein TadG